MLAHQIMSRHVVTVGVDASVTDAIAIMLGHQVSGLPVVDTAGRLVGILTNRDVRFATDTRQKIVELMTTGSYSGAAVGAAA